MTAYHFNQICLNIQIEIPKNCIEAKERSVMLNIKKVKTLMTISTYQYFYLVMQIACLSGVIIMMFDALWSATIFLPLSVGVEILVKFIITHVIEHFIHHQ